MGLPFFAPGIIPHAHPLKVLTVVAPDDADDVLYSLMPLRLVEAVEDGRLSNLRTVSFSKMCEGTGGEVWEDEVVALADLLEQLGKKDHEDGVSDDSVREEAGVWLLQEGFSIRNC